MLIPKKDRITVFNYIFKEGVLVAKKDFYAPKHMVINVKNLYVIKLAQSLVSRGYLQETFAWRHYYWILTQKGLEYLRGYLHLPEVVVPDTFKKPIKTARPRGGYDDERPERGDRQDRPRRFGRGDGERGGRGDGEDRPRRFGRGDGERRGGRGDGERRGRGDGEDRPRRFGRGEGRGAAAGETPASSGRGGYTGSSNK
eukprot:TRINITY_DN7137_c0_g4_i1.p1 TRINITY_DN7137_c0_g4~~TRINITY_DN7137_c0_g4_i1.p1  ORF type:complete len:199 (+),score=25.35 TRINITY_DN7137_c0_g4_i1:104-700(+)